MTVLYGIAPEPRWLGAAKFAGRMLADLIALLLIAITAPAVVFLLAILMGGL